MGSGSPVNRPIVTNIKSVTTDLIFTPRSGVPKKSLRRLKIAAYCLLKYSAARGGRRNGREYSMPIQGTGSAVTPPPFP